MIFYFAFYIFYLSVCTSFASTIGFICSSVYFCLSVFCQLVFFFCVYVFLNNFDFSFCLPVCLFASWNNPGLSGYRKLRKRSGRPGRQTPVRERVRPPLRRQVSWFQRRSWRSGSVLRRPCCRRLRQPRPEPWRKQYEMLRERCSRNTLMTSHSRCDRFTSKQMHSFHKDNRISKIIVHIFRKDILSRIFFF